MYQKPSFIKVEVNVKDNFANYEPCEAYDFGEYMFSILAQGQHCKEFDDVTGGLPIMYDGGEQCYRNFQNLL